MDHVIVLGERHLCAVMLATSIGGEHTCPRTRLRRRGDQFKPLAASKRGPSLAACIITTFVFDFRQGQPLVTDLLWLERWRGKIMTEEDISTERATSISEVPAPLCCECCQVAFVQCHAREMSRWSGVQEIFLDNWAEPHECLSYKMAVKAVIGEPHLQD